MTLADAHIHLFENGFHGRYGRSPAGGDEPATYETLRHTHQIGRALVVGYEGQPRYRGNNDYVRGLAAERDWIVPLAYVEAREPPEPRRIERLLAAGFAGLSIYLPDGESGRALAGWPAAATAPLARHGAIVSLNATPEATRFLGPPIAALPGCRFLFSHLGLPGRCREVPPLDRARMVLAPLLALAGHHNVGVKYSGLYAVSEPSHGYPHRAAAPFGQLLLERFGPERMYWGSDFPPALDSVSFAQAADIGQLGLLSETELAAVMGGNLRRLLSADGDDRAGPDPRG